MRDACGARAAAVELLDDGDEAAHDDAARRRDDEGDEGDNANKGSKGRDADADSDSSDDDESDDANASMTSSDAPPDARDGPRDADRANDEALHYAESACSWMVFVRKDVRKRRLKQAILLVAQANRFDVDERPDDSSSFLVRAPSSSSSSSSTSSSTSTSSSLSVTPSTTPPPSAAVVSLPFSIALQIGANEHGVLGAARGTRTRRLKFPSGDRVMLADYRQCGAATSAVRVSVDNCALAARASLTRRAVVSRRATCGVARRRLARGAVVRCWRRRGQRRSTVRF